MDGCACLHTHTVALYLQVKRIHTREHVICLHATCVLINMLAGEFDERVEHEGCKAEDEKWIARIWRHEKRVPPPYGLPDDYLTA
jgi:hypothetical protein